MKGFPVTIRTLDPPLHEFVPMKKRARKKWPAKWVCRSKRSLKRVQALHEFQPMLVSAAAAWHRVSRDHEMQASRHLRGGLQREKARN